MSLQRLFFHRGICGKSRLTLKQCGGWWKRTTIHPDDDDDEMMMLMMLMMMMIMMIMMMINMFTLVIFTSVLSTIRDIGVFLLQVLLLTTAVC